VLVSIGKNGVHTIAMLGGVFGSEPPCRRGCYFRTGCAELASGDHAVPLSDVVAFNLVIP
jgi:hypothetical protein